MSRFANNALLGGGVRLGFGLENKDQKEIKGTTKPLMANLDITRATLYVFVGCV